MMCMVGEVLARLTHQGASDMAHAFDGARYASHLFRLLRMLFCGNSLVADAGCHSLEHLENSTQ